MGTSELPFTHSESSTKSLKESHTDVFHKILSYFGTPLHRSMKGQTFESV